MNNIYKRTKCTFTNVNKMNNMKDPWSTLMCVSLVTLTVYMHIHYDGGINYYYATLQSRVWCTGQPAARFRRRTSFEITHAGLASMDLSAGVTLKNEPVEK